MSEQVVSSGERATRFYVRWAFTAFVLILLMIFNLGACTVTNNPFWWNGKRYNKTNVTETKEHYEESR